MADDVNQGRLGIRGAPDVMNLVADPLYRMLRSAEPFGECPVAADGGAPACRDIRVVGTWAHQLDTYLDLVGAEYGLDIRNRVQQVILRSLNRRGNAGSQFERFLELTHQTKANYNSERARRGGAVGVTLETYLAVALLIKIPDSPYFVGPTGMAPQIPYETLEVLSRCLESGANRVRQYYQLVSRQRRSFGKFLPGAWLDRLRACLLGRLASRR